MKYIYIIFNLNLKVEFLAKHILVKFKIIPNLQLEIKKEMC